MPANPANQKRLTVDRHPLLEMAGIPPEFRILAADLVADTPLGTHVQLVKARFAKEIQEDFGPVNVAKIDAPLSRFALKASLDLMLAVRQATGEAGLETSLRVLNAMHAEMIKEIVAERVARQMATGNVPSRQASLAAFEGEVAGREAEEPEGQAQANGAGDADAEAGERGGADDDFAGRVARRLAAWRPTNDDDPMVA